MKTFLSQISFFMLSLSVLCTAVYYADLYPAFLPSERIYEAIEDSKLKSSKVKRLIIGDSVGDQLFSEFTEEAGNTYSLASNQAIDIIGQYILLYNFLEANDAVEEVYLVYNPFSFKNNLDHQFTYNYFLKPFYRPENRIHFTQKALQRIEQLPYHELVWFPPVAITFWTPEVKPDPESDLVFLSDISIEYLVKMQQLAREHQVKFKIISPPIKESRKKEVVALYKIAQQELSRHNYLAGQFNNYFNEIQFLQDSQYVDQIHLKNPEVFTGMVLSQFKVKEEHFVLAKEGEGGAHLQ